MVAPTGGEEIGAASDRRSELLSFDGTKAGTKGLVDAGITKLPRIFHHPPESIADIRTPAATQFELPVIDLEGLDRDPVARSKIVGRVREAAEEWGFMQVVNHGIPARVMEEMIEGFRSFMEQDSEMKKEYYTRDLERRFRLNTNFDLFTAPAANWRDSAYCFVSPNPPPPQELPQVCR